LGLKVDLKEVLSVVSEHFYGRNRKKYHQLMKSVLDKTISSIGDDEAYSIFNSYIGKSFQTNFKIRLKLSYH
jgi:hypothetical protein